MHDGLVVMVIKAYKIAIGNLYLILAATARVLIPPCIIIGAFVEKVMMLQEVIQFGFAFLFHY